MAGMDQGGEVRGYLSDLRAGAKFRAGLVEAAALAGPVLLAIANLWMLSAVWHSGAALFLRLLVVIPLAGYWVLTAWWFVRGSHWMHLWLESYYNHYLVVFRDSDILYLVLEHETSELLLNSGDAVLKLTDYPRPPGDRFVKRVAWFARQYSWIFSRLGLREYPVSFRFNPREAGIGVLAGLMFGLSFSFQDGQGLIYRPLIYVGAMVAGVPLFAMTSFARYALARALADALLGDAETAPDGNEDAGDGDID